MLHKYLKNEIEIYDCIASSSDKVFRFNND